MEKITSITAKLVIPKNVTKLIEYICSKVSQTEWSGVLFYTIKGSFEKNNLEVICKDILVLDIGTHTYTEFTINPKLAGYIAENPYLTKCYQGLIHSHCTFNTFFSGTDLATLESEGKDRNHFVSLIVNNEGTYTAAITRNIISENNINSKNYYNSFDNKIIELGETQSSTQSSKIEYIELEINKLKENNSFITKIDNQLQDIKSEKEANKPIYVQKSLFSEYEDLNTPNYYNIINRNINQDIGSENVNYVKNYRQTYIPNNLETENNSITKEVDTIVDDSIVDNMVLQLLTGSIIIPNASKINTRDWANRMVSLYDKRFKNFEDFEEWAEFYSDYLFYHIDSEETEQDILAAIYAQEVYSKLDVLKKNKYIEFYMECLKRLIEYGN